MSLTSEAKNELTTSMKTMMASLSEEERETALIAQVQFLKAYDSVKTALTLFNKGNPGKKVKLLFEFDATGPNMVLKELKVE